MSRFERILLHVSIVLAAASGIVYVVMRDLVPRTDPFSILGHPWQPHVLAAHVLVAPFFVFALGLIAREHILERVRNGRSTSGRRSGVVTILLALPMIVSGYGVQVVTAPVLRRGLGIAHLASGLAFALLYGVHLVRASRRRQPGKGWRKEPADRLSA